jgi:hypothetical protein
VAKSVPPPPAALAAAVDRSESGTRGIGPAKTSDVPERAAGSAEPGELAPQAVKPRRTAVRKTAPTRRLRPGDFICGECGEGNAPTRKFCGRCGESLATAEHVKVRWWRRLTGRRGPKVLKAGQRPARPGSGKGRRAARRTGRRIRAAIGAVMLTFAVLAGLYPPLRTFVVEKFTDAKNELTGLVSKAYDPVRPPSVHANAELPDHPGAASFDQFKNTYWAAPWSSEHQPALTLDLGRTAGLVRLIVTSGASDAFAAHHRPSIVNLSYSNEKSDTVTLRDTPEPQELPLTNGLGAQTVKIQILAVYETQGAADVAVTEFELFSAI